LILEVDPFCVVCGNLSAVGRFEPKWLLGPQLEPMMSTKAALRLTQDGA